MRDWRDEVKTIIDDIIVDECMSSGRVSKVGVITKLRERENVSLREAKDMVDARLSELIESKVLVPVRGTEYAWELG